MATDFQWPITDVLTKYKSYQSVSTYYWWEINAKGLRHRYRRLENKQWRSDIISTFEQNLALSADYVQTPAATSLMFSPAYHSINWLLGAQINTSGKNGFTGNVQNIKKTQVLPAK